MRAAEYIIDAPRGEQERRGTIRMHPSGRYVSPLAMDPQDIDIRDIAHHLSNICRYTGATPHHYSVAQHSVIVSQYLKTTEMRLAGLLHDAAEAYLNDIASPIKHDPRFAFFVEIDAKLSATIYRAFGIEPELIHQTKPFDDLVFQREVASFWGRPRPMDAICPVVPREAEAQFLTEFKKLRTSWTGHTAGTTGG